MTVFVVYSALRVFGVFKSMDDALAAKGKASASHGGVILVEPHTVDLSKQKRRRGD